MLILTQAFGAGRAAREAAERAAREAAERAAREAAGRAAREAAERAAREKLARERRDAERRRLEQLYARLETPPGAGLDTLRKSFHRLMRKHHPDLNGRSPAEQRAATERSMELTAAFNELERLLRCK